MHRVNNVTKGKKKPPVTVHLPAIVSPAPLSIASPPSVDPPTPLMMRLLKLGITSLDFSLLNHPFVDISIPGQPSITTEIVERTDISKILKFESGRLYPIEGVDPIGILNFVSAADGHRKEEEAVMLNTKMLRHIFKIRNAEPFSDLTSHLLSKNNKKRKKRKCVLCKVSICLTPNSLMEHLMMVKHIKKMMESKLVFQLEPLAFWIHALLISQNEDFWVIPKVKDEKDEEKEKEEDEKDIIDSPAPVIARSVNCDNLSLDLSILNNPFQEIAYHIPPSIVEEMLKRTATDTILTFNKYQLNPVADIDPLDILNFVSATHDQCGVEDAVMLNSDKLRYIFECRVQGRFHDLTKHLFYYDEIKCVICEAILPARPGRMINHLTGVGHIDKMKELKLVFQLEPLAFWVHALHISHINDILRLITIKEKEEKEVSDESVPVPSHIPVDMVEYSEGQIIAEEILNKMAEVKILKYDIDCLNPVSGVEPMEILCFISAAGSECTAEDAVMLYSKKLRDLYECRDKNRFHDLTNHLFDNEIICTLCGTWKPLKKTTHPDSLINHLIGSSHIKKMVDRNLVYQLHPLIFWMHALSISQNGYLSFPTEENEEESAPAPFYSPFEIMEPHSPLAVLFHHTEVVNPCKNVRLVTSFMNRKLDYGVSAERLREDEQVRAIMGSKIIKCGVCPNEIIIDCPAALIAHLNTEQHLDELLADGGQVDMDAIFFWFDAMARASKDEEEASAPPCSPLNRKLVAGMVKRTSPISPLMHCKKVHDPCPDYGRAMILLRDKLLKCDFVKFNEAMHEYFREGFQCQCGVCLDFTMIHTAIQFIAHITFSNHVTEATRDDGLVSKKALRFWLDALCEAGATIFPGEETEVENLFGS